MKRTKAMHILYDVLLCSEQIEDYKDLKKLAEEVMTAIEDEIKMLPPPYSHDTFLTMDWEPETP